MLDTVRYMVVWNPIILMGLSVLLHLVPHGHPHHTLSQPPISALTAQHIGMPPPLAALAAAGHALSPPLRAAIGQTH